MLKELTLEKSTLEDNLRIATAPKNRDKDSRAKMAISNILGRQEYYEAAIDQEKDQVSLIEYYVIVCNRKCLIKD